MPTAGMYNTWNRVVHITPIQSYLPVEVYLERTLSISYVDRARQFDYIEWQLDNHDGLLTRPEYVAAGLIFLIKLGYIDGTFPWKAFIINRLQGGVGVWGPASPAVTTSEATITYHGRNRNAAGGKYSKPWSKVAKPAPKKAKKIYGPTQDLGKLEMMTGKVQGRHVSGKSTSDIVRAIAVRNKFKPGNMIIQETGDRIDGLDIPEGMTDGQLLYDLADRFSFIYKIEGDVLHWHSPVWSGAESEVVRVLTYGAGDSILNLSLDADFRLPVPSKVTAKSRDPMRHTTLVANQDHDRFSKTCNVGLFINDLATDGARAPTMLREEVGPTIGSLGAATLKAQQRFLQRHWNAFQINVTVIGDPVLLATRLVEIRGTGCALVDGKWYVSEAKHDVGSNDYKTYLKLKHPPKTGPPKGANRWTQVHGNIPEGRATGQPGMGSVIWDVPNTRKQRAAPASIR